METIVQRSFSTLVDFRVLWTAWSKPLFDPIDSSVLISNFFILSTLVCNGVSGLFLTQLCIITNMIAVEIKV